MKRGILLLVLLIASQWIAVNAQDAAPQKGKISGYMFGDYFFNAARDTAIASMKNNALSGEKNFQAFQFRRIYLTYDNDFSDRMTARFRLEADQSALTSDGKIGVLVKDAYMRWKNIFEGSDLWFGIHPTPAYEYSEAFWGYRSLDKTIMDLRGIVSSRDLGVSLRGKLDGGGVLNYWAMIANGNSTKPENDKFKRFYGLILLKPDKNFQASIYGDYNGAPNINDPTSTSTPKATLSEATVTGALFLGYSQPDAFKIGVEGFIQSTQHAYTEPSAVLPVSLNKMGLSVFGSVMLDSSYSVVARYDYYDPNSNAKGDSRNYFLAGLDWRADKNLSIMPNVQVETYESLPSGHTFDPSVTGRVTFYYIFL